MKRPRDIVDKGLLDFALIEGLAGDRELSRGEENEILREKKERGQEFYSDVLFTLTQCECRAPEARRTWKNLLVHKAKLSAMLGRGVGISVAALDYLTNFRDHRGEAVIVAGHKIDAVKAGLAGDGSTRLCDPATFREKLDMEIYRFRRHGSPLSLVLIDIDNLKRVNNDRGFKEGNGVIASVAHGMERESRKLDRAARWGGEEFALLLPQTEPEKSARVAERIRRRVENCFRKSSGITVSIGVAGCPRNARKPHSLIRRCEEALRISKRKGGNCVTVKPANTRDRARNRRGIVTTSRSTG